MLGRRGVLRRWKRLVQPQTRDDGRQLGLFQPQQAKCVRHTIQLSVARLKPLQWRRSCHTAKFLWGHGISKYHLCELAKLCCALGICARGESIWKRQEMELRARASVLHAQGHRFNPQRLSVGLGKSPCLQSRRATARQCGPMV